MPMDNNAISFLADVVVDRKSPPSSNSILYYPAPAPLLEPSPPPPIPPAPMVAETPKPAAKRRRRRKARASADGAGEAKKRKLSDDQVRFLEMSFGNERKLESGRKAHLASELGLDPKQVAVWFQNRRARWKSKKLEEGYSRLKQDYDAAVLEKCQREAEVLQLKEQLLEAHKEIERLSQVTRLSCSSGGGYGGVDQSSSPSTSFSVHTHHHQQQPQLLQQQQAFLGDFGGDGELLCINDYDNYVAFMEWMSPYHYDL